MEHLRGELDRRRTAPGPHRRTVVLIDGLAALRDEYDDFEGIKLLDGLYRAYADGPRRRPLVRCDHRPAPSRSPPPSTR